MKVRIETPVLGYNGFSAGVNFVNGIAEVEINERQYQYFKMAGYSLTLLEMPKLVENPTCSEKEQVAKPKQTRRKKNAK